MPGIPGRVAGMLWVREAGLHILSYESNASHVRLPTDKFASYLAEEGLDEAMLAFERERLAVAPPAARVAAAVALGAGRRGIVQEAFLRCAKALVAGRADPRGDHARLVRLPLEIVPLSNPMRLRGRGELPVRVLLAGAPLVDVRVAAYRSADPDDVVEARTDARGEATLPIATSGFWVVKCVHITRTPQGPVDWQSLWATLTFERPEDATSRGAVRAYGK